MADVPSQVTYGQVVGHFVQFIADTSDVANVPDELPLSGTVTLTPLTKIIRYPTTTPPRLVVASTIICRVLDGDLCPPGDETTPGVWVIATDQPAGQPNKVQWQATFNFAEVKSQPTSVIFDVPTNGTVDLAIVTPVPPEPPSVLVVSNVDAVNAHQSALDAEASADRAEAVAAGSLLVVAKTGSTWPARPTARTDIRVAWLGPDPDPAINGTGGAIDNLDVRWRTP